MLPNWLFTLSGVLSFLVLFGLLGYLQFGSLGRSRIWTVVVTPLASIIGSGFLVVAPALYHNFG